MKYLIVLDFEATCWEDSKEHEIIEFPSVIVDIDKLKIIDKIEQFVKPVRNPILSDFCKKLTSITQEQVDNGLSFKEAFEIHQKFISQYPEAVFVTCGNWDLQTMLPIDANYHDIKIPSIYKRYINIKHIYKSNFSDKASSLTDMTKKLKLKFEGTLHRGIDDCINIANIAIELLKQGHLKA